MTEELLDLRAELEENLSEDGDVEFKASTVGRPKGSTKKKSSNGRKKKEKEQEEPEQEITEVLKKEDISTAFRALEAMIDSKLGTSPADEDLVDRACETALVVIGKYDRGSEFSYAPEILLVVLIISIAFSKYMEFQILNMDEANVISPPEENA